MLGKPQRHVGTLAASIARGKQTLWYDITYSVGYFSAKEKGLSDNQAAAKAQEITARIVGWSSDADSWLRQHRRAIKKRPRMQVIKRKGVDE